MAKLGVGEYLRDQRRQARLTLRQLAEQTGVSNPYLSQIERGLRKPSAEVLQQIAKALRISAEALYVQAGILEHREGSGLVADAVLGDEGLNERQKQVLLEIYDAFRKENAAAALTAPADEVAVSLVTVSPLPDEVLSTGPAEAAAASGAAPGAARKAPRTAPRTAPRKAAARKAAGGTGAPAPARPPAPVVRSSWQQPAD